MDYQELAELLAVKGQLTESQTKVLVRAIEVFGTADMAAQWFHLPVLALGNARPLDLMSDESGIDEVMKVLGRIEYGVYS